MNRHLWYPVMLLACVSTAASADDRDDYNRRSVERFVALFRAADVNTRFNDIDVTRDGLITWDELTVFVNRNYR